MPSRLIAIFGLGFLVLSAVALGSGAIAQAPQTAQDAPQGPLKIATKPTPAFAIKGEDGRWSGLAIDLMEEVGRELGRPIRWIEAQTTAELLDIASEGRADASVAAITITSEREKSVDFSHAYYDSGLAIAIKARRDASFWAGLQALTSPAFLGTVGVLAALLLAAGAIIWLLEHRRNAAQFEKHPLRGIGSGFWWAAVTMTTVGYGDKAPVTPLGRFVAVIWMFAALILTAVFTAQLTSALTLHRLNGPVSGLADLSRVRTGIVAGTASKDFFDAQATGTIGYPSVQAGLDALAAGRIDAFVHDEPILRYDLRRKHLGKIELLPEVFDAQVYGVALPSGSVLREPLNQAMLQVLASPRWTAIKAKYLGQRSL